MRELVRPVIYRVLRRIAYGFALAYAADFFLNDGVRDLKSYAFALCAALAALGAWLAYLRLDGMHLPKRISLHLPKRKKPVISYGDIDDHIDELSGNIDALEPEAQEKCALIADAALLIIFAILSVIY